MRRKSPPLSSFSTAWKYSTAIGGRTISGSAVQGLSWKELREENMILNYPGACKGAVRRRKIPGTDNPLAFESQRKKRKEETRSASTSDRSKRKSKTKKAAVQDCHLLQARATTWWSPHKIKNLRGHFLLGTKKESEKKRRNPQGRALVKSGLSDRGEGNTAGTKMRSIGKENFQSTATWGGKKLGKRGHLRQDTISLSGDKNERKIREENQTRCGGSTNTRNPGGR